MPGDPLAAISALVTPVENRLATDPRLWRALNPHDGSLPVAASDALLRLAADLKPTLEALSRIAAPAHTKGLVTRALIEQSAGMTTLARAIRTQDPAAAARLSQHAAAQLHSAAQNLTRADLPATGGA
jgi:hypothetical protein